MAKTEVVLIQNIVGLGGESDQVRVASGYARNYLFPQGLAVPLTGANKKRIEALKKRRSEREAHEFSTMTEMAKSVTNLIAVIAVKTGEDGKLFGAITPGMIADQLKTQFDIVLEKRKIHLESPIKTLGEHVVELRLHSQVTASLKVRVESTTPLALPAAAAPSAAPAEGKDSKEARRTESRGHRRAESVKVEEAPAAAAPEDARPEKKSKGGKAEKSERSEKGGKGNRHKGEE